MSDKKPLYLLAGGRRGGDKSITLALREIAGLTGTVSPNIAYVGAASGDNRAFYLFISAALKSAGAGKIDLAAISPRKASLDKVKKIIEDSDAVFISGGDVEAGMGVLQKKNMVGYFQDVYARGKVFFGASAGSIMLAREWVRWKDPDDDSSAEIFPCLGLAPVICDTHAEDDGWEELKVLLELEGDITAGYGITGGSCLKVFPGGRVEALGGPVACFARTRQRVEQAGDLMPG